MFESTKKALGKAPHLLGSHHRKDPEIEIWTKDFAAAKVAMNTLDREIKESQAGVSTFVKVSLELYNDFVSILTCDSSLPAKHEIPDSPNVFAPLQEIVGKVESIAHTHAHKTDGYVKNIRQQLNSVEELLKQADHKKAECDGVVEHDKVNYDDPKLAEIPQVQEYLKYHYHMLSLIPQVIKNLERLIELLIEKQLGYQLEVFGLVREAIQKVAKSTNTPQAKDNVAILQNWSKEIEPVVAQLAKTKTVGSFAVAPPPPHTWQRAQHVPQQVVSSIPSVEQTRNFATGVGGSFKYGLSYIYPMDVKFFNPSKGMFGQISDNDRKVAEAGKEVGDSPECGDAVVDDTLMPVSATNSAATGSAVSTSATFADAPRQSTPVTTSIPAPVQPLPADSPKTTPAQPAAAQHLPQPTPTQPQETPTPLVAPAQPGAREAPPSAQVKQTASSPAHVPAPMVTAAPATRDLPITSTTAAKVEHYENSPSTAIEGEDILPVTGVVPITSPVHDQSSSAEPAEVLTRAHRPATASTQAASGQTSTGDNTNSALTKTPVHLSTSSDDELL